MGGMIDKYQEKRISKLEKHIETINKELGEIKVSIATIEETVKRMENGKTQRLNFCYWLIGVLLTILAFSIKNII